MFLRRLDFQHPDERRLVLLALTAAELRARAFPAGSMGPKVEAACRFAAATGKTAAIGALADLNRIIAGEAGTTVSSKEADIVYAS